MKISVSSDDFIRQLMQRRCTNPFDGLGLHREASGKGLVLRVWRPDATSIHVHEYSSGLSLGNMAIESPGGFVLSFPNKHKHFCYQLVVTTHEGERVTFLDPFQFPAYVLKATNIEEKALYGHLGAHLIDHRLSDRQSVKGVLFRVHAPGATSVSIVGDFNQWDGRIMPMARADDGVWRLFVPGVTKGNAYKFEIHDPEGNLLPLKADPFGLYHEQWPGLASIVVDRAHYRWKDDQWMSVRKGIQAHDKPISVYEVHAGSWKRDTEDTFLDYRQLAAELIPYVKQLGFTHIELMPVSEHPFYDSCGYLPVGLFSPTSRFGEPDDFKAFVDQCHQQGIGVILDWVPAHFPEDEHGLAHFDGTALYEHPDPQRGWHADWKTCIYDFGKPWVSDFLVSNALFWLDDFHIDGLRIDAVTSMLYLDHAHHEGEEGVNNQGGNINLDAVAFIQRLNASVRKRFPDVITIAEELACWQEGSQSVSGSDLGFDYWWNAGWVDDSLNSLEKTFQHKGKYLQQVTDCIERGVGQNNVLPLSHDEVSYGKGSLLSRMPGEGQQQFAILRAYLGLLFTHPGKKLLFMGCEFGVLNEWDHNHSLKWSLLRKKVGAHNGIQRLVTALNALYRKTPALYEQDMQSKGFSWLECDDKYHGVFAFARYAIDGRCVVVLTNMTTVVYNACTLNVPQGEVYTVLLNTDDAMFGGSSIELGESLNVRPPCAETQTHQIALTLPALTTVILSCCQSVGLS